VLRAYGALPNPLPWWRACSIYRARLYLSAPRWNTLQERRWGKGIA
jgi:hypothetical protein